MNTVNQLTKFDSETLQQEIVSCLMNDPTISQVILFGSYAKGCQTLQSDVDIAVLVKDQGINGTYKERLERTLRIFDLLDPIREKIDVDLLVYTVDEWDFLSLKESPIIKQIKETGILIQ